MEADRATESYSIYSLLLKQGPIGWRTVNRRQWLIEDTTSSTPLGSPCRPQSSDPFGMNPHDSVKAPVERRSEWDEVLSDFDQRCQDVLQLERRSFRMDLPPTSSPLRAVSTIFQPSSLMEQGCTASLRCTSTRPTRWLLWSKACGVEKCVGTGPG